MPYLPGGYLDFNNPIAEERPISLKIYGSWHHVWQYHDKVFLGILLMF
jgi:hypothetical protein